MLSKIFVSVLATATLSLAAPAAEDKRAVECPGKGAFYRCANNGFNGYCSVDPCDKTWCTDFEAGTCVAKKPQPEPPVVVAGGKPVCSTGSGAYYVCAANGFQGYCSSDPCAAAWCPDYQQDTCAPKPVVVPAAVCGAASASTAYYVCAANNFRGYCSSDPCAAAWCPDFEPTTCTPKAAPVPVTKDCAGTGAYYVCASNGFRGQCSVDACNQAWCPDFEAKTCDKKTTTTTTTTTTTPTENTNKPPTGNDAAPKPWECAAGTGYYQVCSNGFKGCCKQDACSLGYCPAS